MKEIRTRFAPSPTGMLHIGGFRSAFYAWLLAKHHDGKFILRIEDTDQARKVPGAIKYILEGFEWFGLDIDEGPTRDEFAAVDELIEDMPELGGPYGPYIQSLRLERYQAIAEQLISQGFAFRCDCTPEMLEKEREEQREKKEVPGYGGRCRDRSVPEDVKHVVRFKMPDSPNVEMEDGIRGTISWESIPLRDPVILKSNGFPIYHLAVVVDDHDMKISHAMRGEEWISSSPLHILIYRALEWEPPIFCHLPVVLGSDGKKLSKRHGSTSWSSFRDEGYLADAVLNFIVRLGWSPGGGDEQEIFSMQELIEKFSLSQVKSSSAVFEYDKLDWMNGVYLRELKDSTFDELATPFLSLAGVSIGQARWKAIIPELRERTKKLSDVGPLVSFLDDSKYECDTSSMLKKGVDAQKAILILEAESELLSNLDDFSDDTLENALKPLTDKLGLKVGQIYNTLRIAVTGQKVSPPLFACLRALGKEASLDRIACAVSELKAGLSE